MKTSRIASLYKAERGFGGDNYYYLLSPPCEECNVACVAVVWGLGCKASTVISFFQNKMTEDILAQHSYEKEDHTCMLPEEALAMFDYEVVGKVIWGNNEDC